MIDFVIFAITFVVALIAAVVYLYPGSKKKPSCIPGLDPSDVREGNLPDIVVAGSLHQFLSKLHEEHGPIASFWMGQSFTVSLASPELFKQHSHLFDRPVELFSQFEPLIGKNSIQYANGADGRKRRAMYDKSFTPAACYNYYSILTETGLELVKTLESLPEKQHIPVYQYMMSLAIKSITQVAFGEFFKDDKEVIDFLRSYEICFSEMESKFNQTVSKQEAEVNNQKFKTALKHMQSLIENIVSDRQKNRPQPGDELFIDFLINADIPKDQIVDDSITYIVGGFHTTGALLTWAIYFLASHEDIEENLYKELKNVLDGEIVSPSAVPDLKYLQKVIDETLRTCVLAPYAARVADIDIEVGGYVIPKKTPVLHALGIVLQDEKIWSHPHKFDPTRFEAQYCKSRPHLAFVPFGFAGKRICPGYKFANTEAIIFLSMIFQKFKVHLTEDQVVTPKYGFVTKPAEEVWITISKRQ